MQPNSLRLISGLLCLGLFLRQPAFAENSLSAGRGEAMAGEVADVPLSISTDAAAQGFVMVFEWDEDEGTGVELITRTGDGEALAAAELVETRVESSFMVLAVVLDLDGQGGEVIPAGDDIDVGVARIRCEGPATGERTTAVRFVDNEHARVEGGPLLTNSIAQGGLPITVEEGLELDNGSFVCQGEEGPPVPEEPTFACGGPLDDEGIPEPIEGPILSTHTVSFYYRAPIDDIQGLSVGVKFSCGLTLLEDSFSIDEGVLAPGESTAEFVHFESDNDSSRSDGDGCEFTVGVLVDAVPPFDGRTLPRTANFRKLFDVDFMIEDDVDCGECAGINFIDGVDGNDGRPVDNLVSIEFESSTPELLDCEICVVGAPSFQRGDCNLSGGGRRAVDIADAAAIVGFVFLEGDAKFDAPCEDACDANDDGRLDAADVVFLLEFLFVPESPEPPLPGPDRRGVDPTADDLGCEGGNVDDCDDGGGGPEPTH